MQKRFWALLVMCTLAAMPAWAQETRGNINGVISDAQGVIPGANVRISNTENGQTQSLVTNESGYFEAPLLQAGPYRVTVEMPNFKTLNQDVVLSVGQTLSVRLALEVGNVSETVNVTAEAPILDTTSVSSGQNFDRALIEGLPMAANQPILLAKFAQGITGPTTQQLVLQGQIDGPNDGAGIPTGGVGSFNYTIDGATNAGNNRRMAASPNSDMVQEMRVETSNFDASQGHGTGANISLMTRAGTNATRGTFNYQYWTNQINSLNPQQKLTFKQRPETGKLYKSGHSHNGAFTLGGPIVLPKIVNGRNKLFFFVNYQKNYDDSAARNTPTITVPANEKHLNGDFSDLLTLGSSGQYQIYDPLSVRPDPARPGSFIRTPFPNNIIPKDRIMNANGTYKNPLFGLYRSMVAAPNQNFVEQGQIPTGNYYQGGVPNLTNASNFGGRIDYNASESDRLFFRYAGTTFHEQLGDWTYESPEPKFHGMHINDKTRASWAYTGNWTKVKGSTVFDTQVSANRFFEDQQRRGMHQYKPTDVGLPSYLDEFCSAAEQCMMPVISIAGYQGVSNNANGGLDSTNFQAQTNLTSVKGDHTLRAGLDYRLAQRRENLIAAGNLSSTYSFDNTFTRAADTTAVFPTNNIGPSLAAFMLGIPTQVSIGQNAPLSISNPYYAGFVQDTWRATQNLTLNFGLRYEFEDGIKEAEDRWITEFDPDAQLAITSLAQAAYARSPIPEMPVSSFRVLGGPVYAGASDLGKTWEGESMFMPRFSAAYKLGERTVIKGGYGLFYDTLNAGDYRGPGNNDNFNQLGYTSATTNVASTDFGQSWLLGDPRNGVLPIVDPFPVRSGTRFEPALADSLGANALLGSTFNRENPNRRHARVNRWRIGVQRELFRNTAVEVAYSGSYADRVDRTIQESYIPESYYSSNITSRDASAQTLLQQQVTNPFFIDNFAALRTSDPVLYQRMANNAFFQARTTQRQNLIRAYPQLNTANANPFNDALVFRNLPLGIVKQHSLEVTVNRRYSNGLSANLAFSLNSVTENRTVEAYDREPTMWQPSQNARPFRMSGGAVYEFPFGENKRFLSSGGALANIIGGWQMGGTFEYQPGQILDWGGQNIFYSGNLEDIAKDDPEIALNRDGTLDLSKFWFNTAGFANTATTVPAPFQKRAFPFRIDGVRGPGLFLVNTNIVRNFGIGGGRTFQFRLDVQNLFDAVLWNNPTLDPQNSNFGKVTGATNSIMRFFTFVMKVNF
ncbi:MAG TPA: carboxypeptidase-like regulatory domain-containing protein [Vicinamibacterales bacterium]|nr:carboxypeptidase-like regulatory domain-containing protein [Vicinamibacterales bacterium]